MIRKLFVVVSLIAVTFIAASGLATAGAQANAGQRAHPPIHFVDSSSLQATQAISQNVELVGQIGGPAYAVAAQDNYAYVGVGPSLVILDVFAPTRPALVGQLGPWPYLVQDVAVVGMYAYVADSFGGLRVVDVSVPTDPREIGSAAAGDAHGVVVVGDYAYVADSHGYLRIMDISCPSSPRQIGAYRAPREVFQVAVAGSYAYVAGGRGGLRVVDISDPTSPHEVGAYSWWGVFDVALSGDYAYIAAFARSFQVIAISDPKNPTRISSYETPGAVRGVQVVEPYAYVADDDAGLRILYLGDKYAPAEIGSQDTPGSAYAVAVAEAYVYVADESGGLRIVKTRDPSDPIEVGAYDPLAYAYGVAVTAEGYAYVADWDGGLRVVNVVDPAHPARIGTFDTPGEANDVAVTQGYAYVADGADGLRIVNISDPARPTEAGSFDTPEYATDVVISGSYAYVADARGGLRVINVADPAALTEAGFDNAQYAYDVAVAGSYAYVAGWLAGLRIVNISDPATLTEVGVYTTSGRVMGVAVAGHYAYIAAESAGLRILDVSDPAHPLEVGACDTPGYAWSVAIASEGYVYVADGYSGLRVINVSDPTRPTEVGFYDTPGYAYEVAAAGGYAYVADNDGGLAILRYRPTLEAAFTAAPTLGTAPLTVVFTNATAGDYATSLWDFGDGMTSTWKNPAHTFIRAGTYTVALTVRGLDASDTLTRANLIHADLPQPIFSAPVCGTTNNASPAISGLAPGGFTITLYDNGARLLAATAATSNTFTLAPALISGPHVLTATATSTGGTGIPSRPLTLTVSPALPYDPVGVVFAYATPWGAVTQHPRDSSGCANPGEWRVWLREWYTTTVAVPVRYTTSAAVTITLGTRTIRLTEGVGRVFTGVLTPPVDGGTLVITVTSDGQTVVSAGLATVDTDGYVFDQNVWQSQGVMQRLTGVTVTCEYFDTAANEWMTWNAWAYDRQANPQVTGADGYYSFFAPPATYRITASHPDYWPYSSPDMVVIDAPARLDIPLLPVRRVYLPLIARDPQAR